MIARVTDGIPNFVANAAKSAARSFPRRGFTSWRRRFRSHSFRCGTHGRLHRGNRVQSRQVNRPERDPNAGIDGIQRATDQPAVTWEERWGSGKNAVAALFDPGFAFLCGLRGPGMNPLLSRGRFRSRCGAMRNGRDQSRFAGQRRRWCQRLKGRGRSGFGERIGFFFRTEALPRGQQKSAHKSRQPPAHRRALPDKLT